MIAVLVHGFNVWDGGRSTVGKLKRHFKAQNIPCVMVRYGWFGIGRTYLRNRRVAQRVFDACSVARMAGSEVIVVGHSNGCAIANIAAKHYGAEIDKAVYINPALDATALIGRNVKEVDVWYSPSDAPVKWSKFLPLHPWGDMGAKGYMGTDRRVTNYNKERDFVYTSSAHSDVFDSDKIHYFGPVIVERALRRL